MIFLNLTLQVSRWEQTVWPTFPSPVCSLTTLLHTAFRVSPHIAFTLTTPGSVKYPGLIFLFISSSSWEFTVVYTVVDYHLQMYIPSSLWYLLYWFAVILLSGWCSGRTMPGLTYPLTATLNQNLLSCGLLICIGYVFCFSLQFLLSLSLLTFVLEFLFRYEHLGRVNEIRSHLQWHGDNLRCGHQLYQVTMTRN